MHPCTLCAWMVTAECCKRMSWAWAGRDVVEVGGCDSLEAVERAFPSLKDGSGSWRMWCSWGLTIVRPGTTKTEDAATVVASTRGQFSIYRQMGESAFAIPTKILCKIFDFSKVGTVFAMPLHAASTISILGAARRIAKRVTYCYTSRLIKIVKTTFFITTNTCGVIF